MKTVSKKNLDKNTVLCQNCVKIHVKNMSKTDVVSKVYQIYYVKNMSNSICSENLCIMSKVCQITISKICQIQLPSNMSKICQFIAAQKI